MATPGDERKFLSEFIEIYKDNPCLWKIKSKDYSDRVKKDAAYELLVARMKERDPAANKETVTKKINNIRSTFRKECKKVAASMREGGRDMYTPHLWYYDDLLFLKDQEPTKPSISSLDELMMIDVDNLPSSDDSSLEAPVRPPSTPRATHTTTQPRKKSRVPGGGSADNLLAIIAERLGASRDEDEFDAVGKNIASKLRKMSPDMQVIAEKLISDVVYEGQMGSLTLQSRVVTVHGVGPVGNHLTMGGYQINCPDGYNANVKMNPLE